MSAETSIQWTDHTFNPWWGCTKVHAGCTNCYAERDSKRYGFAIWGKQSERRTFGDKHWAEPVKWNKQAEHEGRRHRVFCASMADVFEDHPTLPDQRKRLFDLICRTPWLDWQVLTKRPENALRMMVEAGLYACENPNLPRPQPNLWIGTSPCDQETANKYVPLLMKVPAAVRFLSCEPLLGPIDLRGKGYLGFNEFTGAGDVEHRGIDWVICGGESGPGARPCGIEWIVNIVNQCRAAGVACFVKQLGSNPVNVGGLKFHPIKLKDRKGGDMNEWKDLALRVREFPAPVAVA